MFNNGNQKTASQMIVDLQDKNAKLKKNNMKKGNYKHILFTAYLQGKRDQIYWSTKWEELEPIGKYRMMKQFFTWIKKMEELNKFTEMTKDELITNQQLQIEEYKKMLKENKELKKQIVGKFYSTGQQLNDNVLQMNKDQMMWCFGVVELVEQLNGL